ncbi:MAG TPA: DUF4831 family protein [Bacteroidales bacterium]|nr:DUF4831 family protein [Bacteroidales bacterium]
MKTIIRLSAFLTIIFFIGGCTAQKELAGTPPDISRLSDTKKLVEGSIAYSLPRTVLTVTVEMERSIEKPGPYAKYAGDLLGMSNVIQNENESWSIEGIFVKSSEEMDPSELYVIESSSLFQTNVLALKKEGLILDMGYGSETANEQKEIKESQNGEFRSFDLGSDEYFLVRKDTAFKRISIDSSFIRIPYIVENKKRLTADQLAERAAKRLMEIREGKHLILTGEANVYPQSDAAIKEINRMEKGYTELFAGKTLKETRRYTYLLIPKKEMSGKAVTLFQFSELTGPAAGTAKNGTPVTIELVPEQKTKDLTIIEKVNPDKKETVYDKMYYRVPDMVNLKINMGSETLFSSRRLIYQFGEVIQLPANYLIGK